MVPLGDHQRHLRSRTPRWGRALYILPFTCANLILAASIASTTLSSSLGSDEPNLISARSSSSGSYFDEEPRSSSSDTLSTLSKLRNATVTTSTAIFSNSSSGSSSRSRRSKGYGPTKTVAIDTDKIIDEMASAASQPMRAQEEAGVEGVFKSTQVYQHRRATPSPSHLARSRRSKRKRCGLFCSRVHSCSDGL